LTVADTPKLKFLCLGAGAIGTYIGGSLALAGYDVTFVDNPQAAQALRATGMVVGAGGVERRLDSPCVLASLDEALAAGPYDAGIVAVKSFDTPALAVQLAAGGDQIPPLICLQNGVENEEVLAKVLGVGRVLHGTVTTAVGRRGVGNVLVERLRGTGISALHSKSDRLLSAFNRAGLNCKAYRHPLGMKWSKMLTNLLANASSAILNMTPAEIFSHPGLHRMEVEQIREALRVMDRLGIPVVGLPGTPVRLLAAGVRLLTPALSRPLMKKAVGGGRGGKMPSFHIDLHQGRGKSEVDYLNGAVARLGAQNGVTTTVNTVLTQVLTAMTTGEIERSAFDHQPDKLLDRITTGR